MTELAPRASASDRFRPGMKNGEVTRLLCPVLGPRSPPLTLRADLNSVCSVKATGDTGEQYIVDYASCPACGKKLMRLPPNYPLFDVQCEGCTFRCQVKAAGRPQNQIFGAGWNVVYASLKDGHPVPPLIYVANLGNEAAERFRQILGRIERLAWHPT
jgi:hypothetical protein